ncbi:hypothetical protein OIDMADRAFT_108363 [Oidiodendron maius Zn]|uniref:Cytochrome P450 n=1 Tax=Oidiodendron maius (strain Zn) TaxID=913774 RepID=A0A0C3DXK5_OIDMZ|nr:hypothetical protein OIDMADRAFT_108363 [Oidiodendron maius Zn]
MAPNEFRDANSFSFTEAVVLILAILIFYQSSCIVYHIFLSPLSTIPGPTIAAITPLYGFYHDVIRGGQYIWVIEEMHKCYGPIVRIRPDAVHINEISFADQIFGTAGERRDKSQLNCSALMAPGAFISTSKHDVHRRRRAPFSSFFSKQSIRRLEPIIQQCLRKLLSRLDDYRLSRKPHSAKVLFAALTSDVITEYAFGYCWNSLDIGDLNEQIFTLLNKSLLLWHVSAYIPFLAFLPGIVPKYFAAWLPSSMKLTLSYFEKIRQHVIDIKAGKPDYGSTSIMHSVINSNLPEFEKTTERLFREGQILVGAGTDTTATTLAKLVYHLLENPRILAKLKEELKLAIPDADTIPTNSQVEKLPYLNALIKECLRLHPVASFCRERIAPDQDISFVDASQKKEYIIPRGTSMGITAVLISRNADIFPSPNDFIPERFLEHPLLDRYSLAWSRGSRICIGQNIAYSELYLTIACIFRTYDAYDGTGTQKGPTLELFETTREDVDTYFDYGVPFSKPGSKGVRVIVR